MPALFGALVALVFLGLFFLSVNSLSVLRLKMEEVLARLERIERAGTGDPSRRAG